MEETAKLLAVSKNSVGNWLDYQNPPVHSLWDAIKDLFESAPTQTLEQVHKALKNRLGDVRKEFEYELSELLLKRLVECEFLEWDGAFYRKVDRPEKQNSKVPDSVEQYRDFVDYRVAQWIKVALEHRNPTSKDVERFRNSDRELTRVLERTSYIAHDFPLAADPKDESQAYAKLESVMEALRDRVKEVVASDEDQPRSKVHLQILYRLMDDDEDLIA